MFYANSMPDGENEQDEDSWSKKQAEDQKHAAETSEKRADKSPELEMGMHSQVARARSEVTPGIRATQQNRRSVNKEEDADADAQEEEPKVRVLRQESHFHRAMMKRLARVRKSNYRACLSIKERRFTNRRFELSAVCKPPLLEFSPSIQ